MRVFKDTCKWLLQSFFSCVFFFHEVLYSFIQIIFLGADMAHWCRVPQLDDLPPDVQKKVAIPARQSADGTVEYSSCEMFQLDYGVYNRSQFDRWNRSLMIGNDTPTVECSEWTYDQSQFTSTIFSKVRHSLLHSDKPKFRGSSFLVASS